MLKFFEVEDPSGSSEGYTAAAFRPDGLILETGTSGLVKIWDVKSQVRIIYFCLMILIGSFVCNFVWRAL